MRKYSFWKSIIYSFFSKDFYQDVGERWEGTGYGYLFWVLLLLSVLRAADLQWEASAQLPGFVKKIPDFKMEKGEFSVNIPQPYTFVMEKSGYAYGIVVDTTGKINSLEQVPNNEKMDNFILLNKAKLSVRRKPFGLVDDKTYDLTKLPSFSVDQEKLGRWTAILLRWVGFAFFAYHMIFWFLFEMVALLVFGLIGLMFSAMTGRSLGFEKALRLAVASHVPGFIISTLLFLVNLHFPLADISFPGMGFCLFALSAAYLYFAVHSQKGPQPPPLTVNA
jgi:hypothetical protein